MLQQPTIKRQPKKRINLKWALFLLIVYVAGVSYSADWPECNFKCRAGDVEVKDIWIGDSQGNFLSTCNPGSPGTVYIWITFENNANSPRYAVILLADIYVNGILKKTFYDQGLCVLGSIPPKAISSMPIYSLSWSCGQQIWLKRLVLSWETAHGASCADADRKCSNRNTKCFGGFGTEIPGPLPLTANYTFDAFKCCCKEINFLDLSTGGTEPYIYSWDFGDGSAKSSLKNPVHRYNSPGQYNISLNVSDSRGRSSGITRKISILQNPVAKAGPNLSIRPGGSAQLAGSAIGGSPPYRYAWSPGESLDYPSSPNPKASPVKTTAFCLRIEDAQGCSASDNLTLYVSTINITKSILKNPVEKGANAVYNYRIENLGDSILRNITVIDSTFGTVFGPIDGDKNGDGLLNIGEMWVYQLVFRPLANTTTSASVSAIDPVGAIISAESGKVTVNVTPSYEPLQCRIVGLDIVCEYVVAVYNPQVIGEDPAEFRFSWLLDGSKIEDLSDKGGIEVPWIRYGGGNHTLQLTAERICEEGNECKDGKKGQTATCNMNVLVVEVPSATIEMDND